MTKIALFGRSWHQDVSVWCSSSKQKCATLAGQSWTTTLPIHSYKCVQLLHVHTHTTLSFGSEPLLAWRQCHWLFWEVIQRVVSKDESDVSISYHLLASGRALLAVGSEDCSVCLLDVCPLDKAPLKVLHNLQGHISSVKALTSSSSSGSSGSSTGPDGGRSLLFSGGARASLKVWSVGGKHSGGVVCWR